MESLTSERSANNGDDDDGRIHEPSLAVAAPTPSPPHYWESHGDYRTESFLEDPSAPLYAHQSSLPPLPVPSLEETMITFLPTALPFAASSTEAQSLIEACERFPRQAAHLQKRLERRQQEFQDSSWLQLWWNQRQYLRYREPLFHVSYFYRLDDDPSCGEDGIRRGAAVLHATATYARSLAVAAGRHHAVGIATASDERGSRPQSLPTNRPHSPPIICATQLKYLFHASRIPRPHQDAFRIYAPPALSPHAVVLCRGHAYRLALSDAVDGTAHSQAELIAALRDIEIHSRDCQLPQLGLLTTSHRDAWADNYAFLCRNDAFRIALEDLQSALCVLALDVDDQDDETADADHPTGIANSPEAALALQFWHGGRRFASNRWMDKSFQLVVTSRGQLGYVGEHSMADGMPAMELCNYLVDHGRFQDGDHLPLSSQPSRPSPLRPTAIFQDAFKALDPTSQLDLSDRVEAARRYLVAKIDEHECAVVTFRNYGATAVKQAKFSPDAYCQVAIQVAGHRVFGGRPVGTYEATQTRKFRHGRTETTRTVSPASQAFVKAFVASSFSRTTKNRPSVDDSTVGSLRALLLEATQSHSDYSRKALNGRGVDRHLWGLSLLLRPDEDPPDLFLHPLFVESKRWRLTTSNVPRARTGFSMVEADGVGIGYDVRHNELVFTLVARRETGYARRLANCLDETLNAMQSFVATALPTVATSAKKSSVVKAATSPPIEMDRHIRFPPQYRPEAVVVFVAVLLLSQIILYFRPEPALTV